VRPIQIRHSHIKQDKADFVPVDAKCVDGFEAGGCQPARDSVAMKERCEHSSNGLRVVDNENPMPAIVLCPMRLK
jgi:hypothetical protein